MMPIVILTLLALISGTDAHAVWAKIPIVEVPEIMSGAAIGQVHGDETLVVLHGGALLLIRWEDVDWATEGVDLNGDPAIAQSAATGGIGATLLQFNGVTKIGPMVVGGTAQLDGRIQENDVIEAVAQDGGSFVDITGWSHERTSSVVRGPAETLVHLRMRRGRRTFEVTLNRTSLPSSSERPRSAIRGPLAILDGRNDGITRLYAGADSGIMELTSQEAGWKKELIPIPGGVTNDMQTALSAPSRLLWKIEKRNLWLNS